MGGGGVWEGMWALVGVALAGALVADVGVLRRFAAPGTPPAVLANVAAAWFVSAAMLVLVPFDVYSTRDEANGAGEPLPALGTAWTLLYWLAFAFTWVVNPLHAGVVEASEFTLGGRVRASLRANLLFYGAAGGLGLLGLLALLASGRVSARTVPGLCVALSNAFGLLVGTLLLAHGLVEVPRAVWRAADFRAQLSWRCHQVGASADALSEAHADLAGAFALVRSLSLQIPSRDEARPLIDQVEREAAALAPLAALEGDGPGESLQGSTSLLGDEDLDYEPDEPGLAALRGRVRRSSLGFRRARAVYAGHVGAALALERGLEAARHSPRAARAQVLRTHGLRAAAVALGVLSVALLLAEATIGLTSPDLSLPSALVRGLAHGEVGTQLATLAPLAYMAACAHRSLCLLGAFSFYHLVPGGTDGGALLTNAGLVNRFGPALCFNYLLLTRGGASAMASTAMESMREVPLLGREFSVFYPMVGVLYAALFAAGAWDRLLGACGVPTFLAFAGGEGGGSGRGTDVGGGASVGGALLDVDRGRELLELERRAIERGGRVGDTALAEVRGELRATAAAAAPAPGAELRGSRKAGKSYREKAADLLEQSRAGRRGDTGGSGAGDTGSGGGWGFRLAQPLAVGRDWGRGAGGSGKGKGAGAELEKIFSEF